MAAVLALASRRHARLVVVLFLEWTIGDAAPFVGARGVARSLRRLLVRCPVRHVLLVVRPRLFWHPLPPGDTVASTMPGSTIEFRHVSSTRPGGRPILHEFDLAIEPGEILALVGRSGAGKTTILKLVNRLLLPDAGEIAVEGRPTTQQDPIELRRRLGYVAQDVGLF